VPGLCLGYEHSFVHGLYEFLRSLDDPKAPRNYPDFRDALGTQYVCDAVLESGKSGRWVKVRRA
jgi:predicted dehydrogenase